MLVCVGGGGMGDSVGGSGVLVEAAGLIVVACGAASSATEDSATMVEAISSGESLSVSEQANAANTTTLSNRNRRVFTGKLLSRSARGCDGMHD